MKEDQNVPYRNFMSSKIDQWHYSCPCDHKPGISLFVNKKLLGWLHHLLHLHHHPDLCLENKNSDGLPHREEN